MLYFQKNNIIGFMVISVCYSFSFIDIVSAELDYDHVDELIKQEAYDEALLYLEEMISNYTDDVDILFYYAYVLDDVGEYDKALNYYDKILQQNPNDVEALYNKAVTLENLERYNEAIEHYQMTLNIVPNDVDALFNMGLLYFDQGMYYGSQRAFQKILDVEPDNLEAQQYFDRSETQISDSKNEFRSSRGAFSGLS